MRSNEVMNVAHPFPQDLVQTQHAWNTTYQALATPGRHGNTELRRALLRLSVQLWWHPYWTTVPSPPAARSRLRRDTRSRTSGLVGRRG